MGTLESRLEQLRERRAIADQLPPRGERRRLRTRVGLSQQDIADAVGVSRESVCRWETTDAVPRNEHLVRYVEVLGVLATEEE